MGKISFDSIAALKAFVGAPAVTSEPIVVDQAMINQFAEVTRDPQWIHIDPVRAAAESPFGTTIAHGFLTLSLLSSMALSLFEYPGRKMGLNYGFNKIRFTGPVPCGSAIVGHFRLDRVEDLGENEARIYWHVEVAVQGAERPALVAEWVGQLRY